MYKIRKYSMHVCGRAYVPVMGGCTLLVYGVTDNHSGCIYFRGSIVLCFWTKCSQVSIFHGISLDGFSPMLPA